MKSRGRVGLMMVGLGAMVVAAAIVSFPVRAVTVDRIVAVVGPDIITQKELELAYATDALGLKLPDPLSGKSYLDITIDGYLEKMIERKVIEQEVQRQGIRIDALEVEKAIDRKRESLSLSPEDFAKELEKQGIKIEDYRKAVKNQLITYRLIGQEIKGEIDISDEDVDNYYKQHAAEFMEKDRLHLLHLFIPIAPPEPEPALAPEPVPGATTKTAQGARATPPAPAPTPAELEAAAVKKLTELRNQIEAGASFEEMAKANSKSPTAEDGGDLGWFSREELLPIFREKTQGLVEGQMTEVFVHGGGAHLIKVKEFKPGQLRPLAQVKDQIHDVLFQQEAMERYDIWLERLRARTHIENRFQPPGAATPAPAAPAPSAPAPAPAAPAPAPAAPAPAPAPAAPAPKPN